MVILLTRNVRPMAGHFKPVLWQRERDLPAESRSPLRDASGIWIDLETGQPVAELSQQKSRFAIGLGVDHATNGLEQEGASDGGRIKDMRYAAPSSSI
jgi:hypothetical protein